LLKKDEIYPKVYLYRRIVQAKLYIDINYADNIELNNIAEEAYFSKFHFIRMFKKIYGKTPYQYLMHTRVEKAKQLLQKNTTVTNVCFSVGFESLSSFSGLFKRIVGISPSAYLLQHQRIKTRIREQPLNFVPGCFADKNTSVKKSNFEEADE